MGPNVKGNPLYMSVYLLIFSYIIGEFLLPKYSLFFLINLLGFMGIISSAIIFFFSSKFIQSL